MDYGPDFNTTRRTHEGVPGERAVPPRKREHYGIALQLYRALLSPSGRRPRRSHQGAV